MQLNSDRGFEENLFLKNDKDVTFYKGQGGKNKGGTVCTSSQRPNGKDPQNTLRCYVMH